MRIAAALLSGSLVLAGCNAPQVDNAQSNEAVPAAPAAVADWNKAFEPDFALGAANQFGFAAKPRALATGYRAEGGPIMLSDSAAKLPNRARFSARGAAPDRLDTIHFALAMNDPDHVATARTRFADVVRGFLFQAKIDSAPIHEAIAKGEPGSGELAGTRYVIARTLSEDGPEELSVTFTRTGASAPVNRQTQGK